MTSIHNSIGSRVITAQESQSFALLSGDFNPLHLDPVRARRYQFGSTLIHGINGTLRGLDLFFADREPAVLTSLQVLFNKPLQQGEEIECIVESQSDPSDRIELHSQGKKVQTIDFSYTRGSLEGSGLKTSDMRDGPQTPTPQDIDIEHAENLNGNIPLVWDPALFEQLFPHLARVLPPSQCAAILGTTNIVGMICPGLNSVYARLGLSFNQATGDTVQRLDYRAKSTDPRFSRVILAVSNTGVTGEIEAFFRPTPVVQASFEEIKSLVRTDQFSEQQAIVIGGSRGLGEVTAKLLAAGGAKTLLTYAKGEEDAARVCKDICEAGGQCSYTQHDILSGNSHSDLLSQSAPITHIYYMASPLIEKSQSGLWDAKLFEKFSDFYIRGLADLLAPFSTSTEYRKSKLSIYVPSTVFLDNHERGFIEYTVAKAAVEAFAGQLRTKFPSWSIHTPRLPRMLTDQTSGIAGLTPLDSAKHILASLSDESS